MGLKIFDTHNLTQPTYEKLMKYLMYYYDENLVDCLNDIEYIEKMRIKLIIMLFRILYVMTLISIGSCSLLYF